MIFQAFTQADACTTRKYGGTGLGLAISARLVKMMRGRIWVESQPGQGSRFHFTVPLGLSKARAAQSVPLVIPSLVGLPVLIVDDNATNRRILVEMTAWWGMKTEAAESGPEALQHMSAALDRGTPFTVTLIDACMPGMDGFQLAEQIKRDPRLETAAIMMLTSAGQRGDAARCRELGISAYLLKPIGKVELREAILTVLKQHSAGTGESRLVTRHSLRTHRQGLRVLVAEDNPVNQALVLRALEKMGHTPVLAENGHQALALWESQPFNVILMDVQMPELDGLAAAAAIREREKASGDHIPIIAMTAYAMKGDRERCLAAGMDGYLSKPVSINDIRKTLEAITPARSHQDTPASSAGIAP